ncbi:MAG: AlpA family phage regulatory protein [bacterium]
MRKSTLYCLMRRASDPFPPNYATSERGRAWIRGEVLQWCQRRRNAEKKLTPIEQAHRLRQAENR